MMQTTTQRDKEMNKTQGRWKDKAHKVQSVTEGEEEKENGEGTRKLVRKVFRTDH